MTYLLLLLSTIIINNIEVSGLNEALSTHGTHHKLSLADRECVNNKTL